jgi:hypothetical protein
MYYYQKYGKRAIEKLNNNKEFAKFGKLSGKN